MMIQGKRHVKLAVNDTVEIVPEEHLGFIVDVTGTLKCKLEGDSAAEELPVVAGVFYPMTLKLAMSTGTTGVTSVFIIY